MRALFLLLAVSSAMAASSSANLPDSVQKQNDLVSELRRGPLEAWSAAWLNRDAAAFAKLCADKTAVASWTGRRNLVREKDGIKEFAWKASGARVLDRAAVIKAVDGYLKEFRSIEHVSLTPTDLNGDVLEVAFDLRGRAKDGTLRTDRGILEVTVDGRTLARIQDRGLETLTAARASFEDITAKSGLAAVERHERLEAIRRGGYALAVGDYDASGSVSIYVGGRGSAQLLHRGQDGVFSDITAKAGLGQDTLVKAAVFADFDNDGRSDLLVQRFTDEAGQELKFYRNAGAGRFETAKASVKRKVKHDRAMSMTAGDFNGDGLLDLYVGYPGTRDFTDQRLDAPGKLAHQAVYMNRGAWKFEEVIEAAAPRLSAEVVRPHSALATDFNGDGLNDILVVDDRGNSSRVYLNKGAESFKSSEKPLGLENAGWGMVGVAGDFNGDLKEDIYFTNIDFSEGRLLGRLLEKNGAKADSRAAALFGGNRLFRNEGGSFREITASAGVGRTGEAPAGAAWLDYNSDGLLDLYVANGLWSADKKNSYDGQFVKDVYTDNLPAAKEDDNPVMRRLQKTGESFGGWQRNKLYRNDGDGSFTEVGFVTGSDRIEDGYVVATADLDKDGRPDLVLRNADPANLGVGFLPLTVLRNASRDGRKSLAILPRAKSGAPAFGTRVTVRTGKTSQVREIRSVEGAVQSEDMAFFGLGNAAKADLVEVRWPSGKVTKLENVAAGRVLVTEDKAEFERLPVLASASGAKPAL